MSHSGAFLRIIGGGALGASDGYKVQKGVPMARRIWTDVRIARPASPDGLHTTKLAQRLLPAACALLLAAPAFGAPSYTVIFQPSGSAAHFNVTQSTPLQYEGTFPANINGSGTSTFSGSAFAFPGHVGVKDRLETHWTGVSAGSRYDVDSRATATDFIITGPASPPIAGQLHLRVRARLEHVGGYAANASHGARVNVDARARSGLYLVMGDLYSTNFDTHGTGALAGLTSPDLDFPLVLSGLFPVGTPFDVVLRMFTIETTYGNGGSSPNPGYVLGDGGSRSDYGLFLEEVSGQVMTLPAEYTLNSASWGVVDNRFQSTVGVGPEPEPGALRLSAHPNPSFGTTLVSLEQPQAAHVRLQVFDVGGRLVRTLADDWRSAGVQRFEWDGRTDDGAVAGTGLYFLRVEAAGNTASGRIVRVRGGDR